MSEKKQINIDQIVQQYTHLHEEGYSIDDRVTKLAELYYKSRVLPIQVIDNLFGQKHSDNIKNLILDYEKKNPVGMDSNVKAWSSVYETHLLTDVFSSYIDAIVQFSQGLYNNIFSKEEILDAIVLTICIKEFIVEIPKDMGYLAGGYIQINIPEGEVKYSDMDVSAHPQDHPGEPNKFESDWSKGTMRDLVMKNDEEVVRAYSMASYPAEGRKIMLNVRVATPPWDRDKDKWMNVNPGVASSYIFSLKKGDKVTISGPYGEFFINESAAEMLYICLLYTSDAADE
mgnify:CR=1 FL=1